MNHKSKVLAFSGLLMVIFLGWSGLSYLNTGTELMPDEPALQPNDQQVDEATPSPVDENPEVVEETPITFDQLSFETEVLMENLQVPWEIVFLENEKDWLITQRSGVVTSMLHGNLLTIDDVAAIGEGGLLGMALHPEYEDNRFIYFYYTTRKNGQLINRVVRYRYENQGFQDRTLIFDDIPGHSNHNGGRIAFGPDGYLYVTTGDAGDTQLSQQRESLAGKILRLTDNGEVPADNPFQGSPVYSYGHRNPQGLAWHPVTGNLYASEHGPRSMDEVNLIQPGKNYGWPIVTCDQAPTDYEDPVACYSDFTLAPSGMDFIDMDLLEGTHLMVAGLRGNQLRHLSLNDAGLPIDQQPLLTEYGRIRTLRYHEGALYFITNNRDGRGTPVATDDRMIRVNLRH